MPLKLSHAEVIGDVLAIRWGDGSESYLPLETLRRACPCASCGGEPDVLGRVVRPDMTFSEGSFEMRSFQYVGGYGIQPAWADGHNTGIFSFSYLKRLEAAPQTSSS